jgi:PIN domain nuclease of toxin-antitoxin system
MHVLLDTHALLWWLAGDPALTKSARRAIAETKNSVYVSAASAWEIATKAGSETADAISCYGGR